jgi:hypothetical protein
MVLRKRDITLRIKLLAGFDKISIEGYSQHMKTLNESVVEKKHHGSQVPRCFRAPKKHLADVTHIAGFRVPEAKFPTTISQWFQSRCGGTIPDDERCIEHKCCLHNGQDKAWHQTQDRVRVRKGHDGQTNVLREEQSSSLRNQSVFCIWSLATRSDTTISLTFEAHSTRVIHHNLDIRRRGSHTFCQLQVRYLIAASASSSICHPTSTLSESESERTLIAGAILLYVRMVEPDLLPPVSTFSPGSKKPAVPDRLSSLSAAEDIMAMDGN